MDQIHDQRLDGRRCRGLKVGDDVVKLITTQIRVISNLSGNVLGSGTLTKNSAFMNYISYIINLKLSKYSIWQGIEEECFKKNYNFITVKFSLNVRKRCYLKP